MKNYSDKISRGNCVYASIVPSSAFKGKGQLYEIKPIGKIHITNAHIIDEIMNIFHNNVSYTYMAKVVGHYPFRQNFNDDEQYNLAIKKHIEKEDDFKWEQNLPELEQLFKKYWDGKMDIKSNPKWVEVLCEKAQIVKKITENEEFKVADSVKLKSDIEMSFYGYGQDGNKKISEDDKKKILDNFENKRDNYDNFKIKIPKGTKGKIISLYKELSLYRSDSKSDYRNKSRYRKWTVKIDGYELYVHNNCLSWLKNKTGDVFEKLWEKTETINESIEGIFDLQSYWGKDFKLMSDEDKKRIKRLKGKYGL